MAYLDNDGLSYLWTNKIKPLIAKYLPLTGGTLTDKMKLSVAPTEDIEKKKKNMSMIPSQAQAADRRSTRARFLPRAGPKTRTATRRRRSRSRD